MFRGQTRSALLAAVVLALLPAAAHAALPADRPPDAATLSRAGVRVSWPVRKDTDFAPGDRLVVRVTALRTGASRPLVRVSLVRVDAKGVYAATVGKAQLRAGRFSTRLPDLPGASYQLRLTVGKRKYFSFLTVSGELGSAPTSGRPGPPSPIASSVPRCAPTGITSFDLDIATTPGRPGDAFHVTVKDTGATCVAGDGSYGWQRPTGDGGWEDVTPPPGEGAYPALAADLAPGESYGIDGTVWTNLAPGPVRLVKTMTGPDGPLTVVVPFTVQQP